MNFGILESSFGAYLERSHKLSDVVPFSLTYIRLLLLFENELSQLQSSVLLERQKQLQGFSFDGTGFDELTSSSKKKMDRDLRSCIRSSREGMLNRLVVCALLDTEETDLFYMTEPMYEFVREMSVSPDQLMLILRSEFVGFKDRSSR